MSESTFYTELTRTVFPFQHTQAYDFLTAYGSIESYQNSRGEFISILPTCDVDIKELQSDNWQIPVHVGNFRLVKHIEKLNDGSKTGLFVKSPERIFTTVPRLLDRGDIWWGGPKSGEKPVQIKNSPLIEEQILWESLTLLELLHQGIRCEVPQAILTNAKGENALVVKEIPTTINTVPLQGPNERAIANAIRVCTSFIPEDFGRHNCLIDLDGYLHIIDVNRWAWPPHSNNFRSMLIAEVKRMIAG